MSDPYASPAAAGEVVVSDGARQRRGFWKKMIWWSISFMVLSGGAGVVVTVVRMRRAFVALKESDQHGPEDLARGISDALDAGIGGAVASSVALVLLVVSIVKFRKYGRMLAGDGSAKG